MPSINFQISSVGPTLGIGIASPRSLAPPRGAASPTCWFRAIADTGCTHTSIHKSLAQRCGLKVVGKTSASTPGGNVAINVYHGDLILRSLIAWRTQYEYRFPDMALCELAHESPDFDALLGMDILAQGVLVVNGGLKQATFSW